MATTRSLKVVWSSKVLETLFNEIQELNEEYHAHCAALHKHSPGSDEYIKHWAEIEVVLDWLQMKIADTQQEMERLSESWPD